MKTIKFVDENMCGQPGLSPFISPKVNWQRDIDNYDVCIYTDKFCFKEIDNSKSNYAWIIEPPIINGENYRDIVKIASNFKKVFSYNRNLESKIPNFEFCAHGGTWLQESEISLNNENKNNLISFIFSDKQWNSYHRLRHRIYNELKDTKVSGNKIDFFGSGCNNRIDKKSTALSSYKFSIVMENSEEDDYFTEKIIDCFLSGVVPIYLGTKNIGKYFNETGILRFVDPEQLPSIFEKVNSEFYLSLSDVIKENFETAKKYINPEQFINKIIEE